jgi:hypothetical protein
MSGRIVVTAAAAAMAAAATGVVAVATPVFADTSADGRTITFQELNKGSRFDYIDNPPRNKPRRRPTFSVGDQFAVGNPLKDSQGSDGDLRALCTMTKRALAPNGNNLNPARPVCTGAFTLRDGTLFVDAADLGAKSTQGAVTGGTGAYVGARGTFTSVSTKTGTNDTITLLP